MLVSVILSFIFSTLFNFTLGQVPQMGDCSSINAVHDFDLEKYSGEWFEAEKYFFIPQMTGICLSLNYTLEKDGSLGTVIRVKESITRKDLIYVGTTRVLTAGPKPTGDVLLTIKLLNFILPAIPWEQQYHYKIIATDYTNYSIKWSCMSMNGMLKAESLWVLSRDSTYPDNVRKAVRNVLRSKGLSIDHLTRSDQNCHHHHQNGAGGRNDETLAVVEDDSQKIYNETTTEVRNNTQEIPLTQETPLAQE